MRLALTLFFSLLGLGCGSAHRQKGGSGSPGPGENPGSEALRDPVKLEPFHVRAKRSGDSELVIEAYDASLLFERAARAYRKEQYEEAEALYRKLVGEFPESSFTALALYNRGLVNEQLDNLEEALKNYLALAAKYSGSSDAKDALFRAVGITEKMGNWEEATRLLDILLEERDDLEGIERVEALARKGNALIEAGEPDRAALVLEEAVSNFRMGRGISPSASNYYYAMAEFKLGEILLARMHEVELLADESTIQPLLEKKCRLLLDAQNQYSKAIKTGNPDWAAAAAFRIGHLYRVLWEDMMLAPVPDDLNAESREVYLEVLKKRTLVLLKKAMAQWERTLKMARRLQLSGEWIERTEQELEEIRNIMAGRR